MLDKDLWKRFLENRCTAKEADFVNNYLKGHPDELEQLLPETEWDNLENQDLADNPKKSAFIFLKSSAWIYKAAAALVILGLSTLFFQQRSPSTKNAVKLSQLDSLPPRWEVIVNNKNKAVKITLEDGSDILLEQHSLIEYPIDFKGNRYIRLTGKATFTVAKDSEHPFSVHAGEMETTVLGTTFEITAYPECPDVSVKLLSGKISVRTKSDPREKILLPGQLYTATSKGINIRSFVENKKISKEVPNKAEATFMRNGDTLRFNKQALSYVFKVLSIEFKKDIVFEEKALEKKFFTGKVITNRPFEKELNSIVLMNQLLLEKDSINHQLIIK